MTTNPYESPEQPLNLPKPLTGWATIAFRFFAFIAILVLLAAFFLANYRGPGPRQAARRMQCSNHLKQICLALHNYHDTYGSLPPACIADSTGKPIHSWRVLLLPFIEQKVLYDKYDFNEPWNGPNNSKLHGEIVHVFCCPSRTTRQSNVETSYVAVVGEKTAWPGAKAIKLADFKDGTSNSILVVESLNTGIHWMEPRDLNFDEIPMAINPSTGPGISSPHPDVALALFADGHTAPLHKDTPPETLRRLLTIADGEKVGDY